MDFNAMLESLWLTDQPMWDISLYALFFFNVINLMIIPEGSAFHTMMGIVVLLAIIIDKTYAFGYVLESPNPKECHAKVFIGTYLIRAGMFVLPLIVAGSTSEGKVRGLSILCGIGGLAYMLGRWYFEQSEVEVETIVCMNDVMVQGAGALITLAYSALRLKLSLWPVNRDVPVTVTLDTPAHHVEI